MQRRPAILLFLSTLVSSAAPLIEPDVELPFDFLHNQIVLRVLINGQGTFSFALDTGTTATSVDRRLARRLGLPLGRAKSETVGAGSGRVYGEHTVCEELRAGDFVVRKLPAVALDLSKVSVVLGRPLHGVLGYNFLASRVAQIDYFRRRIRLYRESPFSPFPFPPPNRNRIGFPMKFMQGSVLPVLEDCYVNGTRISVTIDTGSSLGLVLFPTAIQHLGLEQLARQGIPLDAAGYRGKAQIAKGWVRSVQLKTIDLGAIEVAYVEKGYGEGEPLERRGGSVGNGLLQDFVLTLDYINAVVVLEATVE